MTPGRGLVWPVLLIAIGVTFLLANFGYLPPLNVGRAVTVLWPLVLVLVGIDLALSRRSPGLALALQLVAVAAGLGIVATRPDVISSGSSVGPLAQSVTVAREGATSATLRVSVGAGRFTLAGGATELLEARSEGVDLRQRVTRTGTKADIRLDQQSPLFGVSELRRIIDATVASDVPMTVRVEAGAGEFTIDLERVRATDVKIDVGAASLTLVLPRPSGEVPVEIDCGASSIYIEIPSGVEAKVDVSGGLISVSGPRETAGYAAARDRVTVRVEAGASSISIHQR